MTARPTIFVVAFGYPHSPSSGLSMMTAEDRPNRYSKTGFLTTYT